MAFYAKPALFGKGIQFFIRLINCSGGAYMPSFIQLSDERLKLIYLTYSRSAAQKEASRRPQHGHDIITKMQGWRLVQSKCQTTDASANFVDCSRTLAATSQLSPSLSISLSFALSLCLPLGLPIGWQLHCELSLIIFGSASNQLPDPRRREQPTECRVQGQVQVRPELSIVANFAKL